jgi:hypothetical protein
MPILYGEGEQHAFFRLQVMIFQTFSDYSIFAWKALYLPWDTQYISSTVLMRQRANSKQSKASEKQGRGDQFVRPLSTLFQGPRIY